MIVDTSALVAVVLAEPGHDRLIAALGGAERSGIGTPTLVELGILLQARLGLDPHSIITHLLDDFEIVPVPFGEAHWREAVSAFRRFGRGRHRAGLNFGDCLAYAVARVANEPLLFVGDDFAATDLEAA